MAISIDNGWLAANGIDGNGADGPWVLDQPGETYNLGVDVTCKQTAFIVAEENITFDLMGHTVTYGNTPIINLVNWDFSSALGAEWSGTGSRVAIHRAMKPWGGTHAYRWSGSGSLTSAPITIPAGDKINGRNRGYHAAAIVWREEGFLSGSSNLLQLQDSGGATICSETGDQNDTQRGNVLDCEFNSSVGGGTVRVKVSTTNSGTWWVPFCTIRHYADHAFYCCNNGSGFNPGVTLGNLPSFNEGNPCNNFVLTDSVGGGEITMGTSLGDRSHALQYRNSRSFSIIGKSPTERMKITSNGLSSVGGLAANNSAFDGGTIQGDATILNVTFDAQMLVSSRRVSLISAINFGKRNNSFITMEDCDVLNVGQVGISLDRTQGSKLKRFRRITGTSKGTVANSYWWVLVRTDNVVIEDCTVTPVSGWRTKAMQMDNFEQGGTDNTTLRRCTFIAEQVDTMDTPGLFSSDTVAFSMRNGESDFKHDNLLCEDCTFEAIIGGNAANGEPRKQDGFAMRISTDTEAESLTHNYRFLRCTFRAIAHDTSSRASCIQLADGSNNSNLEGFDCDDCILESNYAGLMSMHSNKRTPNHFFTNCTIIKSTEGTSSGFATARLHPDNGQFWRDRFWGNLYQGGATSDVNWTTGTPSSDDQPFDVWFGSYYQILAQDSSSNPIPGITATVQDKDGTTVANEITGSDGRTPFIKHALEKHTYSGSGAVDDRNPHTLTVQGQSNQITILEATRTIDATGSQGTVLSAFCGTMPVMTFQARRPSGASAPGVITAGIAVATFKNNTLQPSALESDPMPSRMVPMPVAAARAVDALVSTHSI